MKRPLLPAVLLLASIALALCAAAAVATGGERDRWPRDARGVLLAIARAPAKAREQKNPYEGQPDAVQAGEKLYRQKCAECHGVDARGTTRAVNLHWASVQNATPGELAWLLRNGNLARGMPPWAGIPEQRRWQIVAYLKTLR
jgi:mono/diheme cytochrome c family protein